MKLKDFASKMTAPANNIKMAFGGLAGSGKTFTACNFIIEYYKSHILKKPVLIIDNEKGATKFMRPYFDEAKIETYVSETDTLKDIQEAFGILENKEIDFLFIDSLTNVYRRFTEDYKKASRVKFMSLLHWGRIIPLWQEEFTVPYLKLKGNIIFTGRGGYTWEKEEDVKNDEGEVIEKGQMLKDSVKMKLPGESAHEPDFIVWMESQSRPTSKGIEVSHTAQVLKDRSTVLDGKLFVNPKYSDFEPYVKFLDNIKTGQIKALGNNNEELIPTNADKLYYQRQEMKKIELENIKGTLEKYGFSGTGKDVKQLLVLILEKIFGTKSWTAIENLELERVTERRKDLEKFFAHCDESTIGDIGMMKSYITNYDINKIVF